MRLIFRIMEVENPNAYLVSHFMLFFVMTEVNYLVPN
jgi:hypothetical protein